MSIIDRPNCDLQYGNTGRPSCGTKWNSMEYVFFTFPSFYIPTASMTDVDTALAYLRAATMAENPLNRVYPVRVIDFTDNTPAAEKKTTANYGITQGWSEKNPTFEIQFEDLGLKFYRNLSKFNTLGLRMFVGDQSWLGGNSVAAGFTGLEVIMHTKATQGNKANANMYKMDIEFTDLKAIEEINPIYLPENFIYSDEFPAVLDVNLTATGGVGVIDVTLLADISGSDLVALYPTELVDATAFVVKDSTGAAVTTAASVSGSVVTITGSAGALAAGDYTVKLGAPLVLEAAGIGGGQGAGFESNVATATVTA